MLVLSVSFTAIKAQNYSQPDTISLAKIQLSYKIRSKALWHVSDNVAVEPGQLPGLAFKDTIPVSFVSKVPPYLVQRNVYLKFIVQNTADTAINFCFLPGYYFEKIDLYRAGAGDRTIEKIPTLPDEPLGFKTVKMDANQTSVFYCRLQFVKTTVNTFEPFIIREYYLRPFILINQYKAKSINIITFVFSGILLVMIFYSIAVFLQNRNIEFVYYSGYAFFLGLMLFLKSYLFKNPTLFNYFFESYLDFIMQSVGTLIYLSFLRIFINTKKNFPFLHKMLFVEQLLIVLSILMFSYLYFRTDNYELQVSVENNTKYLWSLSTIIFIIYTIYVRNKLLNYLAIGHFFLLTGGLISLYMMQASPAFKKSLPEVLNNSLLYYELGLTIELMFFLAALAFKNKNDIVEKTKESERLTLKNERQEFEKQVAVFSAKQEERNRISEDMHDELGSGVTAIRLMSEIVKSKMKENIFPEINKISNTANDLITKMNTLIWTMKSENDSLESLIAYIRTYALEFFENTSINCVLDIPDVLPNIELSGEKRRNIFLSVKESLTNVLKHSKGNKVLISFAITEKLLITISDNGVGIELDKLRKFGNGLKNIKKRIEGIDGIYLIKKNPSLGTISSFELAV